MQAKFYLLTVGILLTAIGTGFGQPAITEEPQSCTNIAGTTASFTVTATGTLPLAYQWQRDTGTGWLDFYDLTDCTNTTLVLTNMGSADAVDYRVIVTNVDGAITSGVATLTVLLPPTNVKVTPTNSSVSLGVNLTLRVTASGTTPFGYQWCLNCTSLSGRTNSALTLTNVQLADDGSYTVVVTNLAGGVTSGVVRLQVDPTFTKITTGPLATDAGWWFAAAWGDYNNDGYPDLYVWQLAPVQQDFLYRNNGDGTFTRLTGVIPAGEAPWGSAWGDYDNDGYLDLFIPCVWGPNVLLHNRGNGSFEKILSSPGGDQSPQGSTAAWGDYDRDGYLDLLVVNGGLGSSAAQNWLYHNQGNGTFSKMTANQVGYLATESVKTVFGSWVDYDDDGWPDLFLPTLDPGAYVNRNLGNGRFALMTNAVQCTKPEAFAWADYDNDGHLDLCIAGLDTPTALYHNKGDGTFKKMTRAEVGSLVSDSSALGGIAWGDFDNDGYLDLFVAGGWLDANLNDISRASFLYHNNGDGTFTPVRTGSPVNDITDSVSGHWVDYNRDGFLDLFVQPHGVANGLAPNLLYRNNGNSNNWLCVTCVGTASPRDGTGAKVRALATIRGKPMWQLRLINSGGTCWGGQSFVAHFGLGDATNVDVLRIEWSSGTVQELYNVSARQYLTVTEPAKLAMPQPGQLNIQCWKGMAYRIEASPNLSAWTPLATVTNLTGRLQWTDTNGLSQSVRFYRAVTR
jgi:hypothetical protein